MALIEVAVNSRVCPALNTKASARLLRFLVRGAGHGDYVVATKPSYALDIAAYSNYSAVSVDAIELGYVVVVRIADRARNFR